MSPQVIVSTHKQSKPNQKRRRKNYESENEENIKLERKRLITVIKTGIITKDTLESIIIEQFKSDNGFVEMLSKRLPLKKKKRKKHRTTG